jgi:hypothetical protein
MHLPCLSARARILASLRRKGPLSFTTDAKITLGGPNFLLANVIIVIPVPHSRREITSNICISCQGRTLRVDGDFIVFLTQAIDTCDAEVFRIVHCASMPCSSSPRLQPTRLRQAMRTTMPYRYGKTAVIRHRTVSGGLSYLKYIRYVEVPHPMMCSMIISQDYRSSYILP